MASASEIVADLLSGQLTGRLPISLVARGCDLRPRFIPKCQAGRGHRAIARNGRVLLASDVPLTELAGRPIQVRLQLWHRTVLPRFGPEPYGLLLCVRGCTEEPRFVAKLTEASVGRETPARLDTEFALAVEVGGGQRLAFLPIAARAYTGTKNEAARDSEIISNRFGDTHDCGPAGRQATGPDDAGGDGRGGHGV